MRASVINLPRLQKKVGRISDSPDKMVIRKEFLYYFRYMAGILGSDFISEMS